MKMKVFFFLFLCGFVGEKGRTNQEKVVVLRLATEVLEDALLPELLHGSPVVDLTVLDGVLAGVGLGNLSGLVSDEKVEILDSLLLSSSGGRSSSSGSSERTGATSSLGLFREGDGTGDDVVGLPVTGVSHLGVTVFFFFHRQSPTSPPEEEEKKKKKREEGVCGSKRQGKR